VRWDQKKHYTLRKWGHSIPIQPDHAIYGSWNRLVIAARQSTHFWFINPARLCPIFNLQSTNIWFWYGLSENESDQVVSDRGDTPARGNNVYNCISVLFNPLCYLYLKVQSRNLNVNFTQIVWVILHRICVKFTQDLCFVQCNTLYEVTLCIMKNTN
jgi:hypothetical protein